MWMEILYPDMRQTGKHLFLTFLWMTLVSVACNLGSSEAPPPTLAPRITDVPVSTIGYATQVPGQIITPTPGIPATPLATTLYTMLSQVDSDRLVYHIDTLQNFGTRHVNSVGKTDGTGISAAYNYLSNEFTKVQNQSNGRFVNLSPHPFTMTYNSITTLQNNVFGVINGTEAGRGVIVVGAHYDSRTDDLTDATSAGPGADDNGSGVAAVLELARVLSQYPLRGTVLFVLFAGEEEGNFGSRNFITDYVQKNNLQVTAMLNLDTIGNIHDSKGNINDRELRLFADPEHAPSLWMAKMVTFIAENNGTDLEVKLQNRIDREGRFGDHQSFRDAGYPAMRFIEAYEESNHREGLDYIEYVEPDYLRRATRTILTVIVALADGPQPPDYRNIVIRDNGDGTQRLVWQGVPEAAGYVVALRLPGEVTFGRWFSAGSATIFDYDRFVSTYYEGIAIAAIDAQGIMGPLSVEYRVP